MQLLFLLRQLELLLALLLLRINGHLRRFGHGRQGAFGGKVEHVALPLLAATKLGMGLHTEDGLHVVGGRRVLGTLHAEHSGPLGHAHAGG